MTPRSFLRTLECAATGAALPTDRLHNLSPAGKPILCRYDLGAVADAVTPATIAARGRGMWRWRELLPLPPSAAPVTLGEGDTPLLPAPRLGRELGIPRLLVKDEGGNPTGSFKARGISAAVSLATHLGAEAFVVPSAGNAGGALAAYAARAGRPAHVYVPADTPEINKLEVRLHGGVLHEVEGLIDACGRQAAAERESLRAFDVSTLKEPYRIEGKKTMGLELAEALGLRVPDVIIYPTGGGTGLVGMHKAFAELAELGWIPRKQPRFVSVQAEGCAPMVRAFHQGAAQAEPWQGAHTLASGLRVPAAVGDFLILEILRSTGGTALAVSDAELLAGMAELARLEGVGACPEGGACVAAARRLAAEGWIAPTDEVVIFNTGAGTKYLEALRRLA